jgi:hypothetical protein
MSKLQETESWLVSASRSPAMCRASVPAAVRPSRNTIHAPTPRRSSLAMFYLHSPVVHMRVIGRDPCTAALHDAKPRYPSQGHGPSSGGRPSTTRYESCPTRATHCSPSHALRCLNPLCETRTGAASRPESSAFFATASRCFNVGWGRGTRTGSV